MKYYNLIIIKTMVHNEGFPKPMCLAQSIPGIVCSKLTRYVAAVDHVAYGLGLP